MGDAGFDEGAGLPESFTPEEIEEKTDTVFAHVVIQVRMVEYSNVLRWRNAMDVFFRLM